MSEVSNERIKGKKNGQDKHDQSNPDSFSFTNDARDEKGDDEYFGSTLSADILLDSKLSMALDHLERASNEIQDIRRKISKPKLRKQSSKSTELNEQNEQIKSELQIQNEENIELRQNIQYFREKLHNSESRALAWRNCAREAEDRTESLKQENQKLKLKVDQYKLLLVEFAPDLADVPSNSPKKRKRVAKEIVHNDLERIGGDESDEKEGRNFSGNCSESEDSVSDNFHAVKALVKKKLQKKKRKAKLSRLTHEQVRAHLKQEASNDSADSSESEDSVSGNLYAVKDHSKKRIQQKKMDARLSRLLDGQVTANQKQGARNDFADSSESEELVSVNSNAVNALQKKMKAKPSRPQDEQIRTHSRNTLIVDYVGSNGPPGIRKLPADWRFPRCATLELWHQWWLGEPERNIPPLRTLTQLDVKFLDDLPLSEEELKGRTGGYPRRRQPAQKILSDLRSLMRFLTQMVEEADAFEEEINSASVYKMFNTILPQLCEWVDFRQIQNNKWNTIRQYLARQMKESKQSRKSGNTFSL